MRSVEEARKVLQMCHERSVWYHARDERAWDDTADKDFEKICGVACQECLTPYVLLWAYLELVEWWEGLTRKAGKQ